MLWIRIVRIDKTFKLTILSIGMAKRGKHRLIHYVAATVFAIVTFVHALRLANGWPVEIGTWSFPMWLSWVGILLAGSLSVILWKTAECK